MVSQLCERGITEAYRKGSRRIRLACPRGTLQDDVLLVFEELDLLIKCVCDFFLLSHACV